MKVGIIGVGGVGSACLMALVMRGCAREIVVLDRNEKRSQGLITDIQYGATLSPHTVLRTGAYSDLKDASLVMITAGINEKTGGATNRADSSGRLRLLTTNAGIYREILSQVKTAAPHALVLVVTDPPDPLAHLAGELIGHERVLSTGTFLDSLRFRWHLAHHCSVNPNSVAADVIGEHGTTEVFLWSSATIGGVPLRNFGMKQDLFDAIEREVRYANITIIEGIQASQYGIGMVCARIAEIIARDEQAVIPIGSYNPRYKTVLSLPSILGRKGVVRVLDPAKTPAEDDALQKSAETILEAYKGIDSKNFT